MPTLSVFDFSCLKAANFDLAPVNIIIGPQGSGKSVTTKLFYFFSDILFNFMQYAERGEDIGQYKRHLVRQFIAWFPPTAWGTGRFNISYNAGAFSVRVLRRMKQGSVSEDVAITFSEWFESNYRRTLEMYKNSNKPELASDLHVGAAIDRAWRIREITSEHIWYDLRDEYLLTQTFIPAGRAFFTSIGRLVAGFEQAVTLDPVTVKFARLIIDLRDRNLRSFSSRVGRLGDDYNKSRQSVMSKFFGGEIKFDNDIEFVETEDGRKIPLSLLSSGQQEIFPMWSLMDYLTRMDIIREKYPASKQKKNAFRELIYIEEPEAHLFPSAQSLLMEYLVSSVRSERASRSLIMTTHSPYIMSKLNLFLKAGQLSRRKKKNQEINEIVPRECWLQEKQLTAYALENGKLRSLMDEDGFIDGTYLDGISDEISASYSELLRIESEMQQS